MISDDIYLNFRRIKLILTGFEHILDPIKILGNRYNIYKQ